MTTKTKSRQGSARAAAVSRLLRANGIVVTYADTDGDRDSVRVERGFSTVEVRVTSPTLRDRIAGVLQAAGYTSVQTFRGDLRVTRGSWT